MFMSISIAFLLLIGINLHASDVFSFPFEMSAKNFERYFKEPRPQSVTATFHLSYSPQKREQEVFSIDDIKFSPEKPITVIAQENDQAMEGKALFNGYCTAIMISPENEKGEKIYSVTMVFCWVFPVKKLIFEEIIGWKITVAENKILSGTQISGIKGGCRAWTVPTFWNLNDKPADFVRMIIQAGWDPNQGMLAAVTGSRQELLEVLLENGADVNRRDQQTFTPLIWAAIRSDNLAVFETLLRHHADVNIVDKHQNNALIWAARNHRSASIIRLLASHTADLNLKSTTGFTVMGELLQYADAALMLELIDKGAKLDVSFYNVFSLVKDTGRLKALIDSPHARKVLEGKKELIMVYALAVNLDSAQYLHSLGWEWKQLRGPQTSSPVLLGCALGTAKHLKFMIDELGYSIPTDGISPLAVAVGYKNYTATKFLLERGAEPIIRNDKGQIIRDYQTSPEIKELLNEYARKIKKKNL